MSIDLNKDQIRARDMVLAWATSTSSSAAMALVGAAGTGKTTTLGVILPDLYSKFSGGVLLTATTGKAALRLEQLSGRKATTLHKELYEPPDGSSQRIKFDYVREAPGKSTLVVIDEASMVTPAVWADLQDWMNAGTKILFVGDAFQLPPVMSPQEAREHGQDFSVFAKVPRVALNVVMRSTDEILAVATKIRETGVIARESSENYSYILGANPIDHWLSCVDGDRAMITWRNVVRMQINDAVRQRLGRDRPTPMEGEPVIFCRNGWGLRNGDTGIVKGWSLRASLGKIRLIDLEFVDESGVERSAPVVFDGREVAMDGSMPFLEGGDWKDFTAAKRLHKLRFDPIPVTWGYCLTAHKAQGSEYRDVVVFLDKSDPTSRAFGAPSVLPDGSKTSFGARWLYTSCTRARKHLTVILGGPGKK